MKRALLALILALPLALSAQFRIVGTGLFTTLNDSTYRAKIDFRPDLTGNSYNATQLNDSMLVLSQKGQLYRLDSFYNASFSSAFIIVVEKNGNWGSPVGQIMVFQNNSSLAAPQAVYGANGATAGMQAGVDTWNALLLKVVSDSAVYWNQAYSNSIDSLNVSGDSLKTITLYRAGGDSISATFVDGGGSGPVTDTLTGEVKGPLDSTYIDTVANIIFTTTMDATVGVGELEYNDTQGSLIQGLKGGNVTNVIGQQIHQRVTNITGATLTKGTAVFLHSSQGTRITVRKALATVDSTSANTFGIVAESIANNQSGYVITEGLITNMNTNALTEGAAVYLSPTVAGELTTTKPQAPQHTVYIGVCVKKNAGSGELFVKIRNGQELDELHDVRISSPDSSASLYYNAAQGVWRDTGAAVLVADTAAMLSPYLKKADTLSLSNRINTKLNISDTSAMLTNYINVADTATMLSSYISNADTATMLSSYISNADTSVFARDFQISGTANRLAMFTGSNTVGNSVVDVTSDTVSIRDYSNSYTTWRFHSNINKRGFIGYPAGTRFYSLVNPSLYAGFMYGDRSAGAQDQQAFTQLTAWNGGGAASGFFSAATTLNGADSTLYFNISGLSANANPTFPAAQMVIQKDGNVGINTTTPTAKLHINNPSSTTPALNIVSNSNVIGSTNDAVRIDMTAGQVNQTNYGVQIFNGGFPSNEGNAVGIQSIVNARNTSYGLSGSASKNWGGASLFGSAIGVYGSGTTDSPAGFSYGGYFKNDTTQGTGFGVFVQTTTPKGSGTVTPLAIQHNSTELMRVQSSGNVGIGTASPLSTPAGIGLTLGTTSSGRSLYMVSSADGNNGLIQFKDQNGADALQIGGTSTSNWLYGYGSRPLRFFTNATEVMRIEAPLTGLGNVGIHTSSPSRPLHVNANSSMIIPSGATGTRPTSGADGDLRYSTTFSNIEFYRTNRWMRPLVGTVANNKVAFASGDTLTSNTNFHFDNTNTRLGIGTATPTTRLHVVGRAIVNLGAANLFINAGNDTLTGANNIGFGANSLISVSSGTQNIAIGGEVLRNTTTGTSNFAIGTLSLRGNITGSNNVSFGTNAMLENTTGGGNLAIGTDAMRKNNADNNVGIGFGALSQNISGTLNTALGFASLLNVTTSENTAIGSQVLQVVTTGKQNTAIGSSALFLLTTGDNNVSIGRVSATALTSGSNNVLIGETAAYFAGSGFGSITTSINNSIIIGQNSRPSAASGNTNEIVIGTSAIGNGSNTTTIGNSSTTKTFFQYGKTYIGTATDNGAYNLQVAGGSYLSGEIKYVNRPAAAAVTNVGVDANGVLREATSSQRFKDNITPYQKGLSDAMRLQAKTYTYKGDTTLQAGFIAEDVHEAGLTEYVNYDKEGKPYSLQYGNMVTLLLNAMKEQQAQIEVLKQEIEALKNK